MIFKKLIVIQIFAIGVLLSGCKGKNIEPSFYYWKTTINIGENDLSFFNSLGVKKNYIRFFDITWDKKKNIPSPTNNIIINKNSLFSEEIVPVVFITQEVMDKINENDIDGLSIKIIYEIVNILQIMNKSGIKQIQIDCDWTVNNKDKYFFLLKNVREKSKKYFNGIIFSATIRLHQIKYYSKTGVPPVDRGVLMIYNTSSPMEGIGKKSILDIKIAKSYLKNIKKYPLKFDIALPFFSWGIQFDKYGKFIRLINDVDFFEIRKNKFLKEGKKDYFVAAEDTFIYNKRIMKDDIVKIEESDLNDNVQILKYINSRTKLESLSIILYHYNIDLTGSNIYEKSNGIKKVFNFYKYFIF